MTKVVNLNAPNHKQIMEYIYYYTIKEYIHNKEHELLEKQLELEHYKFLKRDGCIETTKENIREIGISLVDTRNAIAAHDKGNSYEVEVLGSEIRFQKESDLQFLEELVNKSDELFEKQGNSCDTSSQGMMINLCLKTNKRREILISYMKERIVIEYMTAIQARDFITKLKDCIKMSHVMYHAIINFVFEDIRENNKGHAIKVRLERYDQEVKHLFRMYSNLN